MTSPLDLIDLPKRLDSSYAQHTLYRIRRSWDGGLFEGLRFE
jgi:hypothetical protein